MSKKHQDQTEAQRQAAFDAIKKRDAEKKQQKAAAEKAKRKKAILKAALCAGAAAAVILAGFGIRYGPSHRAAP